MEPAAVDVVIVPDFAGPLARVFEARTLLFLGSWLEHEGRSRSWPLHVAAIGEPPPSVRALAERCGAAVSVHDDLASSGNRFMNKLRGLEVKAATGRILLVDVDVVVLGDLGPAADLGRCFAAQLAPRNRLRPEQWREIYAAAGLPLPAERFRPWILQFEERLVAHQLRNTFRDDMPPYFRSGVVLAPADCGLREHWERFQRLLGERYRGRADGYEQLTKGNQYSLALALARLRAEGLPMRLLPDSLLVTEPLYAAEALSYDQTRVYHVARAFRRAGEPDGFDPVREMERYVAEQIDAFFPTGRAGRWLRHRGLGRLPGGARTLARVGEDLRALAARYVAPAFAAPDASSDSSHSRV